MTFQPFADGRLPEDEIAAANGRASDLPEPEPEIMPRSPLEAVVYAAIEWAEEYGSACPDEAREVLAAAETLISRSTFGRRESQ